ncbi:MAG: hypothetical protein ACM3ON_07425 [Chloroflexota bacterium]
MPSGLKRIGLIALKIIALPLVVLLSLIFALWLSMISIGLFVRKQVMVFVAKKEG